MIKLRKYITGFIIFALLGGLFVFHFIVSYKILSKTSYLIIGDFNYRINEGNEVRDIILSNCPPKERAKNLFLYFTTLKVQYHPHLFTLVNGICRALVSNKKNENLEILLASSFFFLILLISMYKIGALLYDRRTGIFLSFFTSFVPIIFSYLRIQMLDLPLAAMCTLSILFLLRTRYFTSLSYSICAGIVWGLSQLTKEAFLIFFLPAFLFYVSLSLKKNKEVPVPRFWAHIIVSIAVFLIVAGIFYFNPQNLVIFKAYYIKSLLIVFFKRNYIFLFPLIFFHPLIFFLLLPFFIIYCIKARQEKKIFLYSFTVPLFLFSISPNKNERFLLPLVPVFIFMCIEGIHLTLARRVRTVWLSVLMLVSVIQFIIINSAVPFYVRYYNSVSQKFNFATYGNNSFGVPFSFRKDKQYFRLLQILSRIFESDNNKTIYLVLTFHDDRLRIILERLIKERKIPLSIFRPILDTSGLSVAHLTFDCDKEIGKSHYVIDNNELIAGRYEHFSQEIKQAFLKNKQLYALISEININRNKKISIYKKNF